MQTAQWKDQELRGVICVVVLPLFKFQCMFCFHKTDCTCNMILLWETVSLKFQSYVGTNNFGRTKVVVKKC